MPFVLLSSWTRQLNKEANKFVLVFDKIICPDSDIMSMQNKQIHVMSKRRRRIILLLVLPVLFLLSWFDHSYLRNYTRIQPQTIEEISTLDFEKYNAQTFTVIRVIDGDTIDINISDNNDEYTRIRLLGIDAPETNPENGETFFGAESREFAIQTALNKQVTIYLDEDNNTRGTYGRLLGYVQLDRGEFLNELILKEGFAYADTRFRHSFYNKYRQIESRARSAEKGLWKNITLEHMPEWHEEREL